MRVSVSAKHGQLSESVQETIEQKAAKLSRFFDRVTSVKVIVDLEHDDKPKVEAIVSAEHAADFFAADHGGNVMKAFDSVIHKLERQLTKHKEKLTDHRPRVSRD